MTKNKELVQDVRDLLNQLAIKLKNVKNYNAQFNDHGYPIYNEEKGEDRDEDDECADSDGEPLVVLNQNELFLACVKNVVERALKDKTGDKLERAELKYHTSTCY